MNLIDWVVVGLIILFVLNGIYRGFLPSLLNLGGFFLAWIISFLAYPLLSRALVKLPFFDSMSFYIEGAERVGDVELARLSVSGISSAQLDEIMTSAKMPPPFDRAILSNVKNQAFADQGLTTLGEYFDATIYNVLINIFALLLLLFGLYVLFILITNAFSFAKPLPQLRRLDYPLGGAVSLVRGFFSMYMLFALVPVALILLPISLVTDLVNSSLMCNIFYSGSILLGFVSGVV